MMVPPLHVPTQRTCALLAAVAAAAAPRRAAGKRILSLLNFHTVCPFGICVRSLLTMMPAPPAVPEFPPTRLWSVKRSPIRSGSDCGTFLDNSSRVALS